MIEQLFGSKTRAKLLQLFLSNPNRSFYVREITRKIDEQINSVRRELANLLNIGIITSDTNNNRLYYEVNQKYQYYEPLAEMFGTKKLKKVSKKKNQDIDENVESTVVEESTHPLATELKKAGRVDLVLLTGQFTRDDTAGVDVLIIGNFNISTLDKIMADFEKSENKEVRYAVFSLDEYNYRKQINDRFMSNVLLSKKQVIVDPTGLID